jgi:hypothetical protein
VSDYFLRQTVTGAERWAGHTAAPPGNGPAGQQALFDAWYEGDNVLQELERLASQVTGAPGDPGGGGSYIATVLAGVQWEFQLQAPPRHVVKPPRSGLLEAERRIADFLRASHETPDGIATGRLVAGAAATYHLPEGDLAWAVYHHATERRLEVRPPPDWHRHNNPYGRVSYRGQLPDGTWGWLNKVELPFDRGCVRPEEALWTWRRQNDSGQGEQTPGNDTRPTSGSRVVRRPTASVNARMLETIQANTEALGWNCRQWAAHLHCAKASVVVTPTWKDLKMRRERERAERARDRRRRPKGGDRRRN